MLFYVPVWEAASPSPAGPLSQLGAGVHFKLLGFPLMLFITHTVATWSFRNRRRQLRWCNINILLFLLFLFSAFFILETEQHALADLHFSELKLGFYLPLLGIVFNLLARRGIRSDEAFFRRLQRRQ